MLLNYPVYDYMLTAKSSRLLGCQVDLYVRILTIGPLHNSEVFAGLEKVNHYAALQYLSCDLIVTF